MSQVTDKQRLAADGIPQVSEVAKAPLTPNDQPVWPLTLFLHKPTFQDLALQA